MKNKFYLPMIAFMAMSAFVFVSCDNDDSSDTTKPLIELHEPEEGQALEIGNEHGVHLEMDLSDDVMLKSYKIEIHSNFDHHSQGGNSRAAAATVDFSFNKSYDISGAYSSSRYCDTRRCDSGRLSLDGLLHGCRRQ